MKSNKRSIKRVELILLHYNLMQPSQDTRVVNVEQIPTTSRRHLYMMDYKALSQSFIKAALCRGEKPDGIALEYGFSRSYVRRLGSHLFLNAPPNKKRDN